MTEFQRLRAIVLSPGTLFADISYRPSWIVPLALLLLFNLATNFVAYRVLITSSNFERIARERIEWDAKAAGTVLHPGDVDRQTEALRAQREHWYLLPFSAVPVSVLGLTAVFYVVLVLVRAGAPFSKSLFRCLLVDADLPGNWRNSHDCGPSRRWTQQVLSGRSGIMVAD